MKLPFFLARRFVAAETLQETLEKTYRAVERIDFDGMQFRKDIAQKGLARLSS